MTYLSFVKPERHFREICRGDQDRKNKTLVSFDPSRQSQKNEMADFEEIPTQQMSRYRQSTASQLVSQISSTYSAHLLVGPLRGDLSFEGYSVSEIVPKFYSALISKLLAEVPNYQSCQQCQPAAGAAAALIFYHIFRYFFEI